MDPLSIITLVYEFYDLNKRVPELNEQFESGEFKGDINHLFNLVLPKLTYSPKDAKQSLLRRFNLHDCLKFELCKEYYNTHYVIPQPPDKVGAIHIGDLVSSIMESESDLRKDLEDVFNDVNSDSNIIRLCKEFYTQYHRIPFAGERYKDKRLGYIIYKARHGRYGSAYLRSGIEKVFGKYCKQGKQLDVITKIKLFAEFYELKGRMPFSKEKYMGIPIGYHLRRAMEGKGNIKLSIDKS